MQLAEFFRVVKCTWNNNIFARVIPLLMHRTLASLNVRPTSRSLKGFAVDIDRASFGHDVVEIETMSSPEEVDLVSARDSIAALALSLGAQREGSSGQPIRVRFGVTHVPG